MGVGPSQYTVVGWLNTLRGIPLVVPITAGQMHVADPGTDGLSNLSAVVARSQAVFDEPDDVLLTMALTGSPPAWDVTGVVVGDETITHLSFHDDLTAGAGNHLLNARVLRPEAVTNGDVVRLGGGLTIRYTGQIA